MRALFLALAVIAAIALGAGLAWWRAADEPPVPEPEIPHAREPDSVPGSTGALERPSPIAVEALPLASIDPDRRGLARPDGLGTPGSMPEVIAYPRAEKLVGEPLSPIPHRIVGAWDETPEAVGLGTKRAFILVVPPELSDAELADLARDVRDRHRDAEWLTLRVFDSEEAATRPSWTDGGAARDTHLVAELRRNTAGAGEWLRVRGALVDL